MKSIDSASIEQLRDWDNKFSWHPFTPMGSYLNEQPPMICRGEGVKIQDVDGRWYYDGVSSVWLNVHGHNVSRLNQAIEQQLAKIAHSTMLGQGSVPATLLAKRLVEVSPPGLSRVFFSDSGATAVEIALKIAIQYWANQGHSRKNTILGFSNNYHGDTIGAMSVAADSYFHWAFLDRLPQNPRVKFPHPLRWPGAQDEAHCCELALAEVEQLLQEKQQELAALIIEPVQGAGGIIPAPPGFLPGLQGLCKKYDVLFIVDEVATGFGRTGLLFACDAEQVQPDLLCVGKGLTGGYLPVAATLAREQIFEAFLGERRRTLFHGHSFTGNQLGCAVALESLEMLLDLLPALPEKCDRMAERLGAFKELQFVGEVRQQGMMVGIELMADANALRSFDSTVGEHQLSVAALVAAAARHRGLLLRPIGNVVIFMPPLCSSLEELDEMLDMLLKSFEDVHPDLSQLASRPYA